MREFTLTREKYKEIKTLNRQQMESFLRGLTAQAYDNGVGDGVAIVTKEVVDRIDTGIRNTPGIGEKRYLALVENINKELNKEEFANKEVQEVEENQVSDER